MAGKIDRAIAVLDPLMTSIFAGHMLRLLAARLSLKSVEGLKDDVGVHIGD